MPRSRLAAIERLQIQKGNAVGSAILVSLEAIVPHVEFDLHAIILLTDGQSAVGPYPAESARLAAERGVRVLTVGFGTTRGQVLSHAGWSMRVRLDEVTSKKVADLTRGDYY